MDTDMPQPAQPLEQSDDMTAGVSAWQWHWSAGTHCWQCNVAGTAVQTAGSAAGAAAEQVADNPAAQTTAQAGAANIGTAAQVTAQAIGGQVTPQRVESAANTAGTAAWGTLLSLGLAAAAAIAGGYLGAPRPPTTVLRAAA